MIVFCGFVMAWRLAGSPTLRSPFFKKATTEGVVRRPSSRDVGAAARRVEVTTEVQPGRIILGHQAKVDRQAADAHVADAAPDHQARARLAGAADDAGRAGAVDRDIVAQPNTSPFRVARDWRNAIDAGRHVQRAAARCCERVDRALKRLAIIGCVISHRAEVHDIGDVCHSAQCAVLTMRDAQELVQQRAPRAVIGAWYR